MVNDVVLPPKNGKLGEYHKATGFEAVVGYLYLLGREDRILYLVKKGLDNISKEAEENN